MKLPALILFDLDGTLLDNSDVVVEAYHSGMIELGYKPANRQEIYELAGKSTYETGKSLGIKDHDLDTWDEWFWQYFTNYCEKLSEPVNIMPGVNKILPQIAKLVKSMGIVTSNSASNATYLLRRANLLDYFDTIIGKEHTNKLKPHPDPIKLAIEKLGSSEKEPIWFIGDTASDVIAAQQAGITSIAIPQKHSRKDVIKAQPDHIYKNMMEFYDVVLNNK